MTHQQSASPQTLRSQLYIYAQDLQDLIDQHGKLQQRYQSVLQSLGRSTQNNDLLHSSIRYGNTPYLVTDSNGIITQINTVSVPLLGESEMDWCGLPLLQVVPHDHRISMAALLAHLASSKCKQAIELRQITLFDGKEFDSYSLFDVLIVPQRTYPQTQFFWLLQPHKPGAVDDLQSLLQFKLLDDSRNGIVITDSQNQICFSNPAFAQITGYKASEVLGNNPKILSSGYHDEAFYKAFWHDLLDEGSWSGEFFNRQKNGQIYPDWKTVKVIKNASETPLAYLAVIADGNQQNSKSEELSRMAYHDALTGLPDRRLLDDRLSLAVSQAQRDGTGLSLLFIDLDHFKPINDELGHEVGDQVLQEVSLRLKNAVRQGDTAARVGGDEFVILLQSAVRADDVESIASNLLDKLSKPMTVGEHTLLIGASIGCARYPQDGSDTSVLLKHADSAMYAAKRFGGNHFCFHQTQGDPTAQANLGLDLWRALERKEMHVVYQPQVTTEGKLSGCEALLRWTHPSHGAVSPLSFIPISETNGTILPLGDWVLETACKQLRQWEAQGLPPITMSVNVSSRQLNDIAFAHRVCEILLATGVNPQSLELEITESDALHGEDNGQKILQPLRALGVKIAIDDFGTGYSSLSRLKNLPVDRLKIDQRFVRDLATSSNARAISQCFISMGQAMGMEVVAEGVESLEQHQVLSVQGCHLIQGFFTGRPMTADALLAMFKPTATDVVRA